MTDQSDDDARAAPSSVPRIENSDTKTLRIDLIVVPEKRRPANDQRVSELMQSISSVDGLLCPIVVAGQKAKNGKESYYLVAGLHRLEAMKRLGNVEIQCTILHCNDALQVELAEIDENFMRNEPSAAEHALLSGRRKEVIVEMARRAGTLSQDQMASLQSNRRAGLATGPNAGSLQDQANQTGESKDKIYRSMKRFDTLGRATLASIVGTNLDTGVELDSLMKLPNQVQHQLANRAAAGETISAKQLLEEKKQEGGLEADETGSEEAVSERTASEGTEAGQTEPEVTGAEGAQSEGTAPPEECEQEDPDETEPDPNFMAVDTLYTWIEENDTLLRSKDLRQQIVEFYNTFFEAVYPKNRPRWSLLRWLKGD
jgi:ParB family chromosome partitioning protein